RSTYRLVIELEHDVAAGVGAAQPLEAVAGLLQASLALSVIDDGARPVGLAVGVQPHPEHDALSHLHRQRLLEHIEPDAVVPDQHGDRSLEPIDRVERLPMDRRLQGARSFRTFERIASSWLFTRRFSKS